MKYWLLLIVFLTNIIQGITGFAGTAIALPFIVLVTDLETAKAILNFLGLLASIYIFLISYKNVNYREFFKMTSGMLLGMTIAKLSLEGKFNQQTLMLIYGIFVIAISSILFFFKKGFKTNCWIDFAIVVTSGIIHQLYVSGGTLLVIYAINKLDDKKNFPRNAFLALDSIKHHLACRSRKNGSLRLRYDSSRIGVRRFPRIRNYSRTSIIQ